MTHRTTVAILAALALWVAAWLGYGLQSSSLPPEVRARLLYGGGLTILLLLGGGVGIMQAYDGQVEGRDQGWARQREEDRRSLEGLGGRVQALERERGENELRWQEVQGTLEQARKEVESLTKDVVQEQERSDRLTAELGGARETQAALTQELAAWKQRYEEESAQWKTEAKKLEAGVAEAGTQAGALAAALEEARKAAEFSREEVGRLEAELAKARAGGQEVEILKRALTESQAQVEAAKKESEGTKKELENMKKELEAGKKEFEAAKKELEAVKKGAAEATASLAAARQEVEAARKAAAAAPPALPGPRSSAEGAAAPPPAPAPSPVAAAAAPVKPSPPAPPSPPPSAPPLPSPKPPVVIPTPVKAAPGTATPEMDVLVVDADGSVLNQFRNDLYRMGFSVHVARTGQDAIRKLGLTRYAFLVLNPHVGDMTWQQLVDRLKEQAAELAAKVLCCDPKKALAKDAVTGAGVHWLEPALPSAQFAGLIKQVSGRG